MYLLDTNIISELRKPKPHGAVVAWLQDIKEDLYLSAVTIGEIQAVIEITREQDSTKAEHIEQWLNLVAEAYNVLTTCKCTSFCETTNLLTDLINKWFIFNSITN